MIKLKEFCCGCTLRTGTLIILWSTLIADCFRSLFYFAKLLYDHSYIYQYELSPLATIFRDCIFLLACTTGIAVSVIGIYGIQKPRAEFLNLCYYYYLGYAGYWVFMVVILIILPSWYYDVTILSPFHVFTPYQVDDYAMALVVSYIFATALTLYLALTIKSCMDNMAKNKTDIDPDMPDPTTLGYSASL